MKSWIGTILCLFLFCGSWIGAASSSAAAVLTPLSNWLPSWVASTGQGTVLCALQCQFLTADASEDQEEVNQAVLIVIQTPDRSENDRLNDPSIETTDMGGLSLLPNTIQPAQTAWTVDSTTAPSLVRAMGDGVLCAMTGFLPDVDYVQRSLKAAVAQQALVYEDASTMTTTTTTTNAPWMAQHVAQTIRQYDERPLAVQALVVGFSGQNQPGLYTTDPAGQVQSWTSGATVVGGWQPHIHRQRLHRQLQQQAVGTEEPVLSPLVALQCALGALEGAPDLENDKDNEISNDTEKSQPEEASIPTTTNKAASPPTKNHQYQAFLLWQPRTGGCLWGRVDPQQLETCRTELTRAGVEK
mmetsp:Transcript_21732/g.45380  ORF Transcript_21732/g.45380 Transcript_21732/m.45380 type:complete len:356 (-) Transcript_21732:1414-2481(-)